MYYLKISNVGQRVACRAAPFLGTMLWKMNSVKTVALSLALTLFFKYSYILCTLFLFMTEVTHESQISLCSGWPLSKQIFLSDPTHAVLMVYWAASCLYVWLCMEGFGISGCTFYSQTKGLFKTLPKGIWVSPRDGRCKPFAPQLLFCYVKSDSGHFVPCQPVLYDSSEILHHTLDQH